jgi:hypothetical protein
MCLDEFTCRVGWVKEIAHKIDIFETVAQMDSFFLIFLIYFKVRNSNAMLQFLCDKDSNSQIS